MPDVLVVLELTGIIFSYTLLDLPGVYLLLRVCPLVDNQVIALYLLFVFLHMGSLLCL